MFSKISSKLVLTVLAAGVLAFLVIQLIPVNKTNPPVSAEPAWDTAQTRALAKDACFDCHSNETVWPWYAKIAPSSWLLAHDVDEGRHELNFSEWGQGEMEVEEIGEVIDEGEMPPWYYAMMHPDAKLSDAEKQELITGLQATFGSGGGETEADEDEDDD